MTKRLAFLLPLTLLAACNDAPTDEGRAASGEVLEGTISDAMLPIDTVKSEPPLEDPEAFARVRSEAADATGETAEAEVEGAPVDGEAEAPVEPPAAEPATE